jgi:hypothetical protein
MQGECLLGTTMVGMTEALAVRGPLNLCARSRWTADAIGSASHAPGIDTMRLSRTIETTGVMPHPM